MMKKIIYIANVRMPTERAHGVQIAKTVEAFVLQGADVQLLLPERKNSIKENIESYYGLKILLKISYIKNRFAFLESLNIKLYFIIQRLFFNIEAFIYGLKSKADFIYSRDITICFLLSLFGKKVVFEDHEPKLSKKWLYKIFLMEIKRKIVVAKNLAYFYDQLGVSKTSYIIAPNGVDIEEFNKIKPDKTIWNKEFNINSDSKVVLYVGHFYTWKGVYTLVDSANLLKDNTNVVLIGGTDENQEDLKEYIENKKIKNVFIKDFLPHREIIKYIKSANVLVLPNTAKEERSAKYTTPIKLFEYIASNVPIIASRIDSFSEYLKDKSNSLLFEPDNAKELASKINYLLSNTELANKFVRKAYEEVKEYTWKKRVEKILDFIKN